MQRLLLANVGSTLIGGLLITLTHYLYILSSWSLVAEEAVARVRAQFGSALYYDWRIVPTDYHNNQQLGLDHLKFFYARLETVTNQRLTTDWWEEGYDWLVPDRMAIAARRLGVADNSVRLALANAGLREGQHITRPDIALTIAAQAGRLDSGKLQRAFEEPQTLTMLFKHSSEFRQSGVMLRPAFVLRNDCDDKVILSGIWTAEAILNVVEALKRDEILYRDFAREHPAPNGLVP